jgi:hypothetical protein
LETSQAESQEERDPDAISNESDSPLRKLLSKKAQLTLRKIRSLKKALADNSLRAEIEEVIGTSNEELLPASLAQDLNSAILQEDTPNAKMNETPQAGNNTEETPKDNSIVESAVASDQVITPMIIDTAQQHIAPSSKQYESVGMPTARPPPTPNRNVSFAQSVSRGIHPPNSQSLHQGNLNKTASSIPANPYQKKDSGTLHATGPVHGPARVDKAIALKKNTLRPHVHRYTLRFKTIKAETEEEGHQIVQDTLQSFFDIVLQADSKTILPPYLELDRNDKSVPDLSSTFPVSSVDSYHTMKKYFFRLSSRNEGGINWCSIVLAQSLSYTNFTEKAKYSLENNDFSLWPKASDNENTTDVGWLLYSTRAQDEDRLSALLSKVLNENVGVKWKPIRATTTNVRKTDQLPTEDKVRALHVECAVDRLQEVREKMNFWYGSSSRTFPDGTKMRLVPTINSVTSINNRTKLASCIARQAALTAGLASVVTREISTNLLLDRKDPITNKSFRQILMEITPVDKPGTTLFHTIDRQFKSEVAVNFEFHPEHASEAHNLIAGLVPFLKDNGHTFHLKMFTPIALQRQARARWNPETREADSETDVELTNLLAEDDDLNFTNEPTLEKTEDTTIEQKESESVVQINVPYFPIEFMPSMQPDADSVSTFHPGATVNLTNDS